MTFSYAYIRLKMLILTPSTCQYKVEKEPNWLPSALAARLFSCSFIERIFAIKPLETAISPQIRYFALK
jgi:hypothetical protein